MIQVLAGACKRPILTHPVVLLSSYCAYISLCSLRVIYIVPGCNGCFAPVKRLAGKIISGMTATMSFPSLQLCRPLQLVERASFSYQPFLSFCGCCCWPASRWPSCSIPLQNKWTPLFAMLMYLAKPLPTELHITFVRFSQRSLAAWFVFARIHCIIADECILFISLCWRCSA